MNGKSAVLLIFARAPVAGQVNTRLAPFLGEQGAAELQRELIALRVQQFRDSDCKVVLCCTPDIRHPVFQQHHINDGVSLFAQQGDDLGQRMQHAMSAFLQHYDKAVLIGTDAPTTRAPQVEKALQRLDDCDVVLQGAEDGGYTLIAMRHPHPICFHAIPWGTGRVLSRTRANLIAAGIRWQELETGWDIDTAENYQRYCDLFK